MIYLYERERRDEEKTYRYVFFFLLHFTHSLIHLYIFRRLGFMSFHVEQLKSLLNGFRNIFQLNLILLVYLKYVGGNAMKYTCENCCRIFQCSTRCPVCGSHKVRRIIIVNQKNAEKKSWKIS